MSKIYSSDGCADAMAAAGETYEVEHPPQNQFLVFAAANYYPLGGWNDFKGRFSSEDGAISFAKAQDESWWEVVDVSSGQVVASGNH